MVEQPKAPPVPEAKKVKIDDFEFYKNVGEGSFGSVFLALYKPTNKFCAVKQLNKAYLIKLDKTQAVLREKDLLLSMVNKPYIIKLQMTFMDKEHLYFVFDHCKFGTLSNLIKFQGRLDNNIAVFFSAQILESLSQCFDMKIMHRDIKPENILIDENKHLKLIDFGDAKQFEDQVFDYSFEYNNGQAQSSESQYQQQEESKNSSDSNNKQYQLNGIDGDWQIIDDIVEGLGSNSVVEGGGGVQSIGGMENEQENRNENDQDQFDGVLPQGNEDQQWNTNDENQFDAPERHRDTFVGTPLYVSPEMLVETRSLPASDLWALGCIIYQMHVGKVPFEDRSETGTFDKILSRQLVFPPEANLSDQAKDLIDKLLQINPMRRLGGGRPGSQNDLQALRKHPYFSQINFSSLATQPSPLTQLPEQIIQDSEFEMRQSASIVQKESLNLIVREGQLRKKNEYLMKQIRLFVMSPDGLIKYYKDKTLHRGTIILCKQTRTIKTSKSSFEIVTPTRTWYLYTLSDQTMDVVDAWVRDIEHVVSTL